MQSFEIGGSSLPGQMPQPSWNPQNMEPQDNAGEGEESDGTRRPPNAFILYSQAMRTTVRQDNPSLSNTECSRLLGKMWKEVPNDIKLQYKTKASALQDDFKKSHPDYTYSKARRKRALNEILTKTTQGFNTMGSTNYMNSDMNLWQSIIQPNSMGMPSSMGMPPNMQSPMQGNPSQMQNTMAMPPQYFNQLQMNQMSQMNQNQQQMGPMGMPQMPQQMPQGGGQAPLGYTMPNNPFSLDPSSMASSNQLYSMPNYGQK